MAQEETTFKRLLAETLSNLGFTININKSINQSQLMEFLQFSTSPSVDMTLPGKVGGHVADGRHVCCGGESLPYQLLCLPHLSENQCSHTPFYLQYCGHCLPEQERWNTLTDCQTWPFKWAWCLDRKLTIWAEHIPGMENTRSPGEGPIQATAGCFTKRSSRNSTLSGACSMWTGLQLTTMHSYSSSSATNWTPK